MKLFTTLSLLLLTLRLSASAIPDRLAVRAIYGEACGESYAAKVAIGAAIRNRGNLRGVYGLNSRLLNHVDRRMMTDCRAAWADSAKHDPTGGASYWESSDFKAPYWAAQMHRTVQIGKTIFYKP